MPGNPRTLKPQAATTSFSRNTFAVHVHKKLEHEATDHEQLDYGKHHFYSRHVTIRAIFNSSVWTRCDNLNAY